jgi:hypothetical protein
MEVFYFYTELLTVTYYKISCRTVETTNCDGQRRATFGYTYRFGCSSCTSAYSSTEPLRRLPKCYPAVLLLSGKDPLRLTLQLQCVWGDPLPSKAVPSWYRTGHRAYPVMYPVLNNVRLAHPTERSALMEQEREGVMTL